jgi:CheY-like chemotaxis protein
MKHSTQTQPKDGLAKDGSRPKDQERVKKPSDPKRRRVMVVDDNADVGTALTQLLNKLGQDAKHFGSAQEALAQMDQWIPQLCLLDIGMPQIDGYELARRIRAKPLGQSVTLVAITGYGQEDDRQKSIDAGFDQHLVKPVGIDDIVKILGE